MNEMIVREFNGVQIPQRESDGYFNLTAMCKAEGKKMSDWLRLRSSQTFLERLSVDTQIPASKLVDIQKGVPQGGSRTDQGTYGHYQVALELARWLDPGFAILTNEWIKSWMEGKQQPQIEQPLKFLPTTPIVKPPLGTVLKEVRDAMEEITAIRNSPDLTQADKRLLIRKLHSGLR